MRHAILILVLSVLLASCATTKTPLPTDNIDELLGTWVNTEYDIGARRPAKWIWKADGTASVIWKSTSDRSFTDPNWIIEEKWKVANGAIYLVVLLESYLGHTRRHYLIRLSADRSYCEMMVFGVEPPVDIDPKDVAYVIYYRQK